MARTCSTSDVPMPKASAPNAPCVAVCESPQTHVQPGTVKPCSGPMIWTIPAETANLSIIAQLASQVLHTLSFVAHTKVCKLKVLNILFEGQNLRTRLLFLDKRRSRLEIPPAGSWNIVVDCNERAIWATNRTSCDLQPFKSLRSARVRGWHKPIHRPE